MVWLGVAIVILTFAAIIKKMETRTVLLLSGLAMSVIALIGGVNVINEVPTIAAMFAALTGALTNTTLVPAITICMGFGLVMDFTGCSSSLIHILMAPLKKVRPLLVPGAVVITWVINIVLQSASSCAAAVGTLMIPLLMGFGVHPATAATAVLLGTWGNALNPAGAFILPVAELATDISGTEVTGTEVVQQFLVPSIIVLVIVAALLTVIDRVLSKNKTDVKVKDVAEGEKNPIKAIVPFLPILFVILGLRGILPNYDIAIWMLIGSVIGILLDYKHAQQGMVKLFEGMGAGYRDIITLMAAASVFTFGMGAIGLTGALVEIMKSSTSVAALGGGLGPFVIAFLSGSGNAATLAFNNAITPHALEFGFSVEKMGALAVLAGCLGRDASPVAGCTIIVAKMAGVNTMEVVKRAIVPMLVALIVFIVALMFL